MTDQELIAGVLDGDPAAERALYDAHVDRVYRLAWRMTGDAHLAEDCTQDTFVRAFEKLAGFRGESSLATWLCAIAHSTVLNALRKTKRFRERETDIETAPEQPTPGRRSEPDLKERVGQALDKLAPGYRTVFVMHDLEGYTHEEIGETLGIETGTSKAQLSRARARLREMLAAHAGEWQ
ncbi:MAG TPA: RNA polymerase sigma factor [Gemmatimonadales bacterium]|nr:RNA polymerase sigma factor [Gemmatimonadales bacterium]